MKEGYIQINNFELHVAANTLNPISWLEGYARLTGSQRVLPKS